ncbi:MAG: flagellin [Bdellovibrionota bacterium]|nr:flagellin FliC [Pseudobdellovibrionaceae bacterium]|tara:strand:+ start:8465 stop:9298 length:834 start_codon:yes stop_codon:yes gene_type:complete
MGLRISTNIAAINGHRNLSKSQMVMNRSLAQLSSGSRINKAADDAAGLAISETMRGHIRGMRQANRNANDGLSLVQTAEGGLNEIGNMIIRLRELGMQAASDTVGDRERSFINKEVMQLKDEIQRIAKTTKWGDTSLLDGSTPTYEFQVGLFNNPEQDRIAFEAGKNSATIDALGIAGIDFSSKDGAQTALQQLDEAQVRVNSNRSNLGAIQNRLQSTINNLGVAEENMSAANSRIRDTDVAAASADLAKNNVLLQAATATLAQASQSSQLALQLLG